MIWSNLLLILHQSNVKFKIMGLLDFLFGAAIMENFVFKKKLTLKNNNKTTTYILFGFLLLPLH